MPKDNILDFESCAMCHVPYAKGAPRHIHDFGEVVFSTCKRCADVVEKYPNIICDITPVFARCPQCTQDCRWGIVTYGRDLTCDSTHEITGIVVSCTSPKLALRFSPFGKCSGYKEAGNDLD